MNLVIVNYEIILEELEKLILEIAIEKNIKIDSISVGYDEDDIDIKFYINSECNCICFEEIHKQFNFDKNKMYCFLKDFQSAGSYANEFSNELIKRTRKI